MNFKLHLQDLPVKVTGRKEYLEEIIGHHMSGGYLGLTGLYVDVKKNGATTPYSTFSEIWSLEDAFVENPGICWAYLSKNADCLSKFKTATAKSDNGEFKKLWKRHHK